MPTPSPARVEFRREDGSIPTPAEQLDMFRQRHRINPVGVQAPHLIGIPVAGVLAHHVCTHDGLPVYAVAGGWRHDLGAVRHLEQGAPAGVARFTL